MSVHSIGASEPRPTVMSLSETRVAYPKLLTGSQTRLVHIQHGSSSSNFVASLEVVDLDIDTRSSYDALSYHCGDMTAVSQVHLPDLDIYLPIARNLTDALNRVLKDGIPGPFWIDAISINQIDIEERNQQVRLMTRIFRGARQVFSWLGPDDGTLHRAIHLITKWADPCNDPKMSMEMLSNNIKHPDSDTPVEFVGRLLKKLLKRRGRS
ncbi:heterokaryon incompatibility protein-domain-containing protein [Exophiala viscosa]|uniref:Heterokaryon incompatibility protein-domain-containing protein n=1 Tax=Exophiala viscosa TaxID=2486360 RepID=A0AAN6E2U2_9EURO|nr:heterokaryon incompatibility protein-domain-containing protein [Exophiala viscosa]